MRFISVFVLSLMSLATVQSFASGDPEAGKIAYGVCASCHGGNAQGNAALKAPRLTHLDQVYLIAQLEKFKAGIRGGPQASASAQQMAAMTATLPDDNTAPDLAAYIVTLDAPEAVKTVDGDVAVGADYYNQFCGACHGATAQGNVALNSPRLAGGDDWYLLAQLNAFRGGTRGAHPEDRTGRQMSTMARLLPDEKTAADVVAFILSVDQ